MLPSKIDQMKVSHETGSEANFGFGRALMPSYFGMSSLKAAFFQFSDAATLFSSWSLSWQADDLNQALNKGDIQTLHSGGSRIKNHCCKIQHFLHKFCVCVCMYVCIYACIYTHTVVWKSFCHLPVFQEHQEMLTVPGKEVKMKP